jgi:CHAT domain-containing protein/tetratricopeptide (TPR) repeat protein
MKGFWMVVFWYVCFINPLAGQVPDTLQANEVFLEALSLREGKSYRAAQQKFEEATALFIHALDSTNLRIVDMYQYQSGLLGILGNTKRQYELNEKCLFILEKNNTMASKMNANVHNSMGIAASNLKRYDEAAYHYKKAIQISNQLGESPYDIAPIFGNLGILSRRIGKYDDALAYLSKSMAIYKELDELTGVARTHLNIGNVYVGLYENEKAIYHYRQALLVQDSSKNKHPMTAFAAYQGIAKYYKDILEYDYALLNYEKAKSTILNIFDHDHPAYLRNERLMASLYNKMGKHQEAIDVIWDDVQRQGDDLKDGVYYELIGQSYRSLGALDDSRQYITRSAEMVAKYKGKDSRDYNYPLLELGITQLVDKNYVQAEELFLEVYERLSTYLPEDHPRIADVERFLAETCSKTLRFDQAIAYCNTALQKLGHHPDSTFDFEKTKKLRAWEDVHRKKADVLYDRYQYEPSELFAKEALNHYLSHLDYLQKIQTGLIENSSKLQLIDKQHRISERAIALLLDLYEQDPDSNYLANAFELADQAKDNLLVELSLKKKIKREANLKQQFGAKESQLLADIADLELEVFHLEEVDGPEAEILSVKSKILKKRDQILAMNQVENSAKKLTKTHLQAGEKIQKWQNEISLNTAFFELFSGKEETYLFILTSDRYSLGNRIKSTKLDSIVSAYRTSLLDYQDQTWQQKSLSLYHEFLKPPIDKLDDQIKHIVLIQDGSISGIPLESLVINKDGKLLLDELMVSYSPSLSVLNLGQDIESTKAKKAFAAFAPSYDQLTVKTEDTLGSPQFSMLVRSGNYHLPGAQEEVKEIQALTDGTIYLGNDANEHTFKMISNQFQVLHLSMHAILEDKNPSFSRLLFSPVDQNEDGFLFTNELTSLNLNADLAVLSACNTGSGQLKKGEGVLSLARAFNYAGIPATIHSLWKVPDDATKKIMVNFYTQIKAGKSKAKALHLAKKQYLDEEVVPDRKHPYFWAGFVLNGNWEPIQFKEQTNLIWYFLIGAIILLGAFLFLGRNYFKSKT